MNRLIALLFATVIVCRFLLAADTPPVLIRKIDPNQGRSKTGVVFDAAEVELTVDEEGVPFSLESSLGLPDYAVRVIERWRYSPYKKNGRSVPFTTKLLVPVARPLTPAVERHLAPMWYPATAEIHQAVQRGYELSEAEADALEADLPDTESLGYSRTSLLVYYANQGAKNPQKARAARAKLLTWLVEHDPQDDVLGSSFALVNSSGNSLADAETSLHLTRLWVDAMRQNPTDEKLRVHALNFLQVTNPQSALEVLAKLPQWKGTSTWAGDVYGLSAIGVTSLSPATGKAIAASNSPARAAIDEIAREILAKSDDTKMVLAGLVTLASAGRSLASTNHLPDAYSGFCQGILRHAKELYPQTAQSCDTTEVAQDNDRIAGAAYGKTLTKAKFLKRVRPMYPYKAKSKGVQGTIILSALINNSGVIEELGLKSGPFLLYAAAFDAVKEWRYSPARIDNKPVDVLTPITINFNLGR